MRCPAVVRRLDNEVELALVMGLAGEIAGYAVADDVSARDLRTGAEQSVEVKPSYGLTDDQVEQMILDSIDRAEEDFPFDDGQPPDTHVLADPGHGWKYGTSVRVSAERDVLLEEVKDSALAIYSRDVAARVVERTQAVGDFTSLTADRARELARRYDLDFLVTEADLPLPVAYRNAQFRIYALK